MRNVVQNENSPVEMIEGRLKRLHTRDSRKKRVGGREKQRQLGRGKPTNILKRKHRLKSLRKESKDFTRVGWILDYGLRFQEEKREGGWEKKTTED